MTNRHNLVCGIDEVGRGPLCGPVVAACVMIKPDHHEAEEWQAVTDSKKLSAKKRDMLFDFIQRCCFVGVGQCSAQEVDNLNIHHATLEAMKRAFNALPNLCPPPTLALIDGKFAPSLPCDTQTIIKGDLKSTVIAAASIIAKVTRDRMMSALHTEHPHYGWDRNAGYGTKQHLAALRYYGLTPHHRLSFAPCKNLIQADDQSADNRQVVQR